MAGSERANANDKTVMARRMEASLGRTALPSGYAQSPRQFNGPGSDLQIALPHRRIGGERGRAAGPHRVALLDHHVAVGDAGERLEVLVDEQDRLALGLEPAETRPDLGAD